MLIFQADTFAEAPDVDIITQAYYKDIIGQPEACYKDIIGQPEAYYKDIIA